MSARLGKAPLELLSTAGLARRLNMNTPRIHKAISYGLICPDAILADGHLLAFRAERLQEIAEIMASAPKPNSGKVRACSSDFTRGEANILAAEAI